MEAEERPSKLRKLSHDHGVAFQEDVFAVDNAAPSDIVQNGQDNFIPNTAAHSDAHGTVASANQAIGTETDDKPLSKNQLKRIRKKQEWEAQRDERKVLRKEKSLQRRERKKAARDAAVAEGKPLPKPKEHITRKQLPVTIIIDCDFDDLMHEGERISLSSQVTRSYSDNKNARFRAHLTVSSFGGHLRERFEGLMEGMYKSWRGVRFLQDDFVDVAQQAKVWMADEEGGQLTGAFDKYASDDIEALKAQGEVVYLSSEADHTLEELKPFSSYIIGGLVDKNREKGLCHKRATQRGIRTARLPIGDFLDMSSRRVLTTNHVNEIMLKWLEHKDWGKAFMEVIPQRKGGKLKSDLLNGSVYDGGVDDETHDGAEADDDETHKEHAVATEDASKDTYEVEDGNAVDEQV